MSAGTRGRQDGKWVPTFPNARYVFFKPDVDHFSRSTPIRRRVRRAGTFRESVAPILEYGKADLVSGRPVPAERFHRDRFRARPFARRLSSSSKAKANAPPSSATSGTTCCRSIIRTGISRKIRTQRRPRSAAARRSTIARRAGAGVSRSRRHAVCGSGGEGGRRI